MSGIFQVAQINFLKYYEPKYIMRTRKVIKVVLLLTRGNIGSTLFVNRLRLVDEIKIVGVVVSPLFRGAFGWRAYMMRIGLFYCVAMGLQYVLQGLILQLNKIKRYFFTDDRYILPQESVLNGIRNVCTNDIHSDKAKEFIKTCKPDIMISAFFNQILRSDVLALSRLGSINVHPGDVEFYRGAMNYFWVIKHNRSKTAVTIHWMSKQVDKGKIILRKFFRVYSTDTQFSVHIKSGYIGALMIGKVLKLIAGMDKANKGEDKSCGKYYSIPNKSEFMEYNKKKKLFSYKQIFWLSRRIHTGFKGI